MPVRHREAPSDAQFEELKRALSIVLGDYEKDSHLPKQVVRALLDLVGLMLLHAPDNPDEARVIDMYVQLDELLMQAIP